MFTKIAIATALAVLSSGAMAADTASFYAGGDLGRTDFRYSVGDNSVGAFGGYQVNENLALEIGYRRLSHATGPDWTSTGDQLALSAIASIPLRDGFNVYGRLGYNRLTWSFHDSDHTFRDHYNNPLYGVGFSYSFSPTVAARIEVQKADSRVTNLSTGVAFRF